MHGLNTTTQKPLFGLVTFILEFYIKKGHFKG